MKTNRSNEQKTLWKHPWGYRESFLIALELMLLGFIFEVLTLGDGIHIPSFPYNLIIGCVLIVSIFIIHKTAKKVPWVRWLSSVPAAISAVSLFAFLVLLLGFIPQDTSANTNILTLFGLDHVKNSWVFIISGLYLLTVLGFVILRRSKKINRKNTGFLLNHAGLWIVIAAASLGSADLKRFNLNIFEQGDFYRYAYNRTNQTCQLPFEVKLLDFEIEEYLPNLALVDARNGLLVEGDGLSQVPAEKGTEHKIGDWRITINEFIPDAVYDKGIYIASDTFGTAPAAHVSVRYSPSGKIVNGWVSCGNHLIPYHYIPVSDHHFLVMSFPEPREYRSNVVIRKNRKQADTTVIRVNKPYKVTGWKLYQLSYDQEKGKWSDISVLEVVKDPWLSIVYTGIFMLLAGAVYLFWIGKDSKERKG